MVFQFDNAYDFSVLQYGAVGFLGVGLVFLFGDEVVFGRWVESVAQYFDKKLAQETFLELFLLGLEYVLLHLGVEEIAFILCPRTLQAFWFKQRKVFLDYVLLEKHSNIFRLQRYAFFLEWQKIS